MTTLQRLAFNSPTTVILCIASQSFSISLVTDSFFLHHTLTNCRQLHIPNT
ncbi:hypothetical protein K443DRAFT_370039 [Laccaria amethystina LaAM-08-1]|uniref:Uncharacterized protein n=1 Tax=Laccaria amethystina LaAM-08-1 TaxID=1095629 RepID=A0A0C9WYP6_9AGAR|nr:hypothetical protein K443DRAFT_370039 [Laccaria amethystina LaAM-08-1]